MRNSAASAWPKPKVLFVDDEENVLAGLRRAFRDKATEWEMEFAETGEKALRLLKEARHDVLVTDFEMPGITGIDLVRWQNEISPSTRCIFLTGKADLQAAANIINTVDAFRFFTKPCASTDLASAVEQAVALARQIMEDDRTRIGAKSEVLDLLPTGVFVLSGDGTVVYANDAAMASLSQLDGLMVNAAGKLTASDTRQSGSLDNAREAIVSGVSEENVIAISIDRPSMREPLKLIMARMVAEQSGSGRNVVVFLTDPEKLALLSSDMIARLFKLTYRESHVAREMIQGRRTEEIAANLGITISTARTYIKRVMAKTGTSRQQDLMRLLLHTPQISKYR